MLYRLLIAIFALTVVTACGSSSSSDDAPPPPPPANDDPNGNDDDDDNDDNGNGLPEEGDISFRFNDGIDGWHINGTGDTTTVETEFLRISHDADNEAMVLSPLDWDTDNWRLQVRYELDDGVDFSGATATVVLDIPQAYLDDGDVSFQVILMGNSSDSYGEPISLESYDVETQRIELDLGEREEDLSHIGMVAIQFAEGPADDTITDPIAVRSLDFYLANGDDDENGGENDNELTVDVTQGWSNDGKAGSFSYDNGVVITPDWSEGQNVAMKVLGETADFAGATVTWVIDVPAAYITDGELVIQPFVQQNADPYSSVNEGSIPGGWNTMENLQAGENTIVHGPFDEPPADIGRVGIWFNPDGLDPTIDEDIVIRSATITFPEE